MSPQQERAVALTAIAQPPTASPTFGDLASALLWPVKLALTALAVAEPGPFGEMALAAFGKWNGARLARKAGAR